MGRLGDIMIKEEGSIIERITLESRVEADVVVITFKGVFLLTDQVRLREVIHKYLQEGKVHFIFDFEEARTIQSFVIGEILELSRKVKALNGDVCLVNLSDRMLYTMEITRVSEVTPTYRRRYCVA